MTRSACAGLLFSAGLFALGCWGDYEIAAGYDPHSLDSPTEQAPGPTSDSPVPPSRAARPAIREGISMSSRWRGGTSRGPTDGMAAASGPSGEAPPGPTPAESAVVEQARPGPSSPSPPTPALPSASALPTPVSPIPVQPGPSRQPSIRLSAGVALPQSLPTGTAMGFSVDYQFAAGEPSPSSPYAWVIEPSQGRRAVEPVRLKSQGTLQAFFLQFRPENGPFKTHIEDANGNRLSPSLPLR